MPIVKPTMVAKHDADHGDEEGIGEPDPEGAAVSRGVGVVDQRLRDVEAGGRIPEAEAGSDVLPLQIGRRVGDDHPEQGGERDNENDLEEDLSHLGPVEEIEQARAFAAARAR